MSSLGILQKAACAAVYRALEERNVDLTGCGLTKQTQRRDAELAIANFVICLPLKHLPKLVLPEITQHGRLAGGYSQRWSEISLAGLKHDADILARGNERVNVNNNPWPPDTSSSSQSCEVSDDGRKDATRPQASGRQSSDETVKRAP